jgi:3-hydroxyacyl-CoA dehydrogenase, C-terminal domain
MLEKKLVVWSDETRKQDILTRNLPSDFIFEFADGHIKPNLVPSVAAYFVLDDAMISSFPFDQLEIGIPVFVNEISGTLADLPSANCMIRINAWPGFLRYPVLELAARETEKKAAEKVLDAMGWPYKWVADIPGLVTPRVISMIINEACYAVNEKISTAREIDIALKLGTSYPLGPFEWNKQIGSKRIIQLLDILSVNDQRYLPAPNLKRILEFLS